MNVEPIDRTRSRRGFAIGTAPQYPPALGRIGATRSPHGDDPWPSAPNQDAQRSHRVAAATPTPPRIAAHQTVAPAPADAATTTSGNEHATRTSQHTRSANTQRVLNQPTRSTTSSPDTTSPTDGQQTIHRTSKLCANHTTAARPPHTTEASATTTQSDQGGVPTRDTPNLDRVLPDSYGFGRFRTSRISHRVITPTCGASTAGRRAGSIRGA